MGPKKPKTLEQKLRSGSSKSKLEITVCDNPQFVQPYNISTLLHLHEDPVKTNIPLIDEDVPGYYGSSHGVDILGLVQQQQHSKTSQWPSEIPERTWNFRLTQWGAISFSESYTGLVAITCQAKLEDLTVVKFSNADADGEPSDDYVVEMTFTDDEQYFQATVKWENTPLAAKIPQGRRQRFLHDKTHLGKQKIDPTIETDPEHDWNKLVNAGSFCRSVRLVIKDWRLSDGPNAFSEGTFKQILDMNKTKEVDISGRAFCQLQSKAIQAESALVSQQLLLLKRPEGTIGARIVFLPGFQDRFAVRFYNDKKDNFRVPEMSRAFISATAGFFFDNIPGKVPRQPREESDVWQGVTFLRNNKVHCSIENIMSSDQLLIFRAMALQDDQQYSKHSDFSISFDEDADSAITTRLFRANRSLEHVMAHQYKAELATSQPVEPATNLLDEVNVPSKLDYHQYFPGLLLPKRRDNSVNRPIPHGPQRLVAAFADPTLQLGERSHQAAIQKVFNGSKSRTVIEGPPATGKTTVLAKLITLLSTRNIADLDGAVIATAHTNEAVRVLCARTLDILKTQVRNPTEHVCLVISDAMINYWKMSDKKLDPRIEDAMLGAHLERQATELGRNNFKEFLEQRRQIKMYGRSVQSTKESQAATGQIHQLLKHLRSNIKIWFGTLSTLHLQHPIFGLQQTDSGSIPGVNCHVLIIDEASQATDIYVSMAILATDPKDVVFAGDAKQLAPYSASREGETAWALSLFEKLKPRSEFERLLRQFRSQPNLYAGTTAHYDNQVWTDQKIAERPHFLKMLAAVKRISFKDASGETRFLTSNIHIIHVKNTECERSSTGTSTNEREWKAMRSFILALRSAGVRTDEVMVLTPYQGQYDLMRADQSALNNMTMRKIDSSQGDEAECVLFGGVKSQTKDIGFLSNLRRQNVATSRAREVAYYFLTMTMIQQNPAAKAWRTWIAGLVKVNPNLVLTITEPVTWYVDGVQVLDDPARVMKLPQMESSRSNVKSCSRAASPVRRAQSISMPHVPKSSSSSRSGQQVQHQRTASTTSTAGARTPSNQQTPHQRGTSISSLPGNRTPSSQQIPRQRGMSISSTQGPCTPSGQLSRHQRSTSTSSVPGPSISSSQQRQQADRGPLISPSTGGMPPSTAQARNTSGGTTQGTNFQARMNQFDQELAHIQAQIDCRKNTINVYVNQNPAQSNAVSEYNSFCSAAIRAMTQPAMPSKSAKAIQNFGETMALAIASYNYHKALLVKKQAEKDKFRVDNSV